MHVEGYITKKCRDSEIPPTNISLILLQTSPQKVAVFLIVSDHKHFYRDFAKKFNILWLG